MTRHGPARLVTMIGVMAAESRAQDMEKAVRTETAAALEHRATSIDAAKRRCHALLDEGIDPQWAKSQHRSEIRAIEAEYRARLDAIVQRWGK